MDIFDGMASRYDSEERSQVAGIIAGQIREALAGCGGKSAIDYGCGTGLVGLRLADCFTSLLMVDAAPRMIEVVRGKIEAAGLANVSLLCADFTKTTPAGLSADIIFMAQVLLHIPDTANILRRLYPLLAPGGRLLIVDFDKDESIPSDRVHNGFVQADLMQLAQQAGFTRLSAQTFYHGKNIFMNQDASLFLLSATKPPVD